MNFTPLFLVLLLFLIVIRGVDGYKVETGVEVHQYLTNESQAVWKLISYEIKSHLKNPINKTTLDNDYNVGDDIIDGSREEDLPLFSLRFMTHFWNPDVPNVSIKGDYNKGISNSIGSSYRKALDYWANEMIPAYTRGDIDEAYYWLGRTAHLLEDAAQPSHLHSDPHPGGPDPSILEDHTGNNFNTLKQTYNWQGENFNHYDYDNLINTFNWSTVEPADPLAKRHIELFRLFWYTAQKTQYWASDDENGNIIYRDLNNNVQNWQCSGTGSLNLWADQGYTTCSSFINLSSNLNSTSVDREANATIPHAMRAVAGLYRLFDDAVRIDWPTENHDYRRTGFTLLKGDMKTLNDVEKIDFVVEPKNIKMDQTVKAVVADIDGNGAMETVTVIHDFPPNGVTNQTFFYAVETKKKKITYGNGNTHKPIPKWNTVMQGGATYFPPTLADIDGDKQKELIAGTRNETGGIVYAYDVSEDGKTITKRWQYTLPKKWSPLATQNVINYNGGNAVVDIDLDGKNEIIFADVYLDKDWPGEVYVLKDNGKNNQPIKFANYTFGNGGAYATVSVANIDDDDNPEIIVPSFYGIYIFDYNPSAPNKLSLKWSNTDGRIESSAVVADVDADNEYELVYTTHIGGCASGKTCYNRTYVRNAKTGALETQINLSYLPRPTPTVANLDNDANLEVALITQRWYANPAFGDVRCYDAVTGAPCAGSWPFDLGGSLNVPFVSPNIADIDNDGKNDIVFGENDGHRVFVLRGDGTELFSYNFTGIIDNGIAIADVDQDGVAELTLKRAGSPVTLLSTVSSKNIPPALEPVINVTAIASDLINLTKEAAIVASDPNNDNVTLAYSAPFNASGLWQTTANDSGNFTILVEAHDGNLSDHHFVDVIVFDNRTQRVNTLNDSTTEKELAYQVPGNQTVYVRLPKNATIIYTKLTLRGETI